MKNFVLFLISAFVFFNISGPAFGGKGVLKAFFPKARSASIKMRFASSCREDNHWRKGSVPKIKKKTPKEASYSEDKELKFDPRRSLYFYTKDLCSHEENMSMSFSALIVDEDKVVFNKN